MDEQLVNPPGEVSPETEAKSISQEKLTYYLEKLRLEQRMVPGILAGAGCALAGAVLWAVITVATEYQIGYMAVAIGFIVGKSIGYVGKGIDKIFGVFGALLSLVGCLLGNFFSILGFVSQSEEVNIFETLSLIDYSMIPEVMIETFSPIDLLFYGIAIYEGYKFSFRQVTEEELIANCSE